jgi:hypothetical protein
VIQPDTVFAQRDQVMVQRVDGESVLLDIRSGQYFSLNAVGGRVWELCDGATPVSAIVGALCDEYDVEPAVATTDAGDLLAELAGAGLVVEH